MNNILGMILSIVFVVLIIVVSEMIKSKSKWTNEATRKFIHIGVCHWWIFAMFSISEIQYAIMPPLLFIILNYMSYKKNIIKSMERNENKADLGTVYFPISLLILIILTWKGGLLGEDLKYIGAIGILIMGYGDGLAAIVGKKIGDNTYKIHNSKKSIEGSSAMFIISFIVTFTILTLVGGYSILTLKISLIVATFATFIEAITPWGLDNITVPIITSILVYYLILHSSEDIFIDFIFRSSIGIMFSSFVGYFAYRVNSLSKSGVLGAIILGTGIFATSGIYGSALMILFFISSSALSHFKKSRKEEVEKQFDKTGKRDIYQVFANGGVGLIFSTLYFFKDNIIFLIAVAVSFAAANADTWSTELGVLNKSNPFSLRNFKRVSKGTSGAISLIGTLAGLSGAVFIAISFILMILIFSIENIEINILNILIVVSLGGFLGSIIDSILGATVQGIYYIDELGKETERKYYNESNTRLIRGFRIFNNDLVNFLSIMIASILAIKIL